MVHWAILGLPPPTPCSSAEQTYLRSRGLAERVGWSHDGLRVHHRGLGHHRHGAHLWRLKTHTYTHKMSPNNDLRKCRRVSALCRDRERLGTPVSDNASPFQPVASHASTFGQCSGVPNLTLVSDNSSCFSQGNCSLRADLT